MTWVSPHLRPNVGPWSGEHLVLEDGDLLVEDLGHGGNQEQPPIGLGETGPGISLGIQLSTFKTL